MGRAPTNGALAFVAALCFIGLGAGCGSTGHATGRVPWVNRPVARYEVPAPTLIPYPVSAPACHARQLRVRQGRGGAAAGTLYERLVLTNVSKRSCLLRGYPTITGVGSSGSRVRLRPRREGFTFFQLVASNVLPGAHTFIGLATSDGCDGGTRKPSVYRELDISIGNGETVRAAPSVRVEDVCGLFVSSFGVPARYTPLKPAPGTPATLSASVQLPKMIHAGKLLRYTVTLSNQSATAIALDPCPGYNEGIYAAGLVVRRWLALNCDTVHTIAPHSQVRYAMELAIPAKASPGVAKFGWSLDTPIGPSIGRVISLAASR
ncbi:MAG: DUF4232 domain-containing protein [Gaiellaceae bacterium]